MSDIISMGELRKLIDDKGAYVLIDVREKEELDFGIIPTSVNLPLGDVEEALSGMDDETFRAKYGFGKPEKDARIIFYCRTGSRSSLATDSALKLGYSNAKNFEGSIWAWSEIDENVKKY
jgi:thiosulfate:glutathione sulfurtransferase